MSTLIFRTVARAVLHVMMVFAIYLLLRGHNLPGGGFIAGLVAAAAIVLQMLAFGPQRAAALVPVDWTTMVAVGLGLALFTGLAPLLLGYPFMTMAFQHVQVPFWGDVELTTSLVFDVGVFLVVVGTVLRILFALGGE